MKRFIREVLFLLKKDLMLEWRHMTSMISLLLYMMGIIFTIYLVFRSISLQLWNALYWIVILFAIVQVGMKTFEHERGRRKLYYMQLVGSESVFVSKLIYNTLLFYIFQWLSYVGLYVVTGIVVESIGIFSITLLLSSIGFSAILTFTSGVTLAANSNSTLMSILSFPLLLPILLQSITLNSIAIGLIEKTSLQNDYLLFVGIDILVIAIGLGLFMYLWQD